MYESYEAQPEPSSRDDYEAALRQGMSGPEFARYDAWISECEGRAAFEAGWDPFTSNLTPAEYLASMSPATAEV